MRSPARYLLALWCGMLATSSACSDLTLPDAPGDGASKSSRGDVRLTLVAQHEIATPGLNTARPDVARTARRAYLGVTANAPAPRNAFNVFGLDSALASVLSMKTIACD